MSGAASAPSVAFHYTFPAVAASDRLIAAEPDLVERAIRAIVRAQRMLRADISLASVVGRKLFPKAEAEYTEAVVTRDLAYYSAEISSQTVDGIIRFSQACGLLKGTPSRDDIVAMPFSRLWGEAGDIESTRWPRATQRGHCYAGLFRDAELPVCGRSEIQKSESSAARKRYSPARADAMRSASADLTKEFFTWRMCSRICACALCGSRKATAL